MNITNNKGPSTDPCGPSSSIDTACSSSLLALENAFQAIRHGQCDSALVGGVNLLLKPNTSVQFMKLGMLSPDGSCKSFDASGDGYCRSEAAVVVLLTKRSAAKRVYATIVNAGSNTDGYKEQAKAICYCQAIAQLQKGVTYPSGEMQQKLMKAVYEEAGISPADVEYVEAHGTGTKVVLSLEHGLWAPNIHYETPNPDVPALQNGCIRVVTEPIPVKGGIVGVNSFGFGGSNVHVILRPNVKRVSPSKPLALPRLVQ
eukprot:g44612.t1